MIEILIPTTLRPEILDRTCSSFRKYLFTDLVREKIPFEAHINVDLVGPGSLADTVAVARRQFSLDYVRCPGKPSFPYAFMHLWNSTSEDFVFYLEDDWECLLPIDLKQMVKLMLAEPDLAVLRLPWKPAGLDHFKAWKWFFPWNGRYFECPADLRRAVGFCGHPSLIRGEFVRKTAPFLDPTRNPEKQFHHGHPELLAEIDRWRFGVFATPGQPAAIRDIGRQWMVANGLRKAGSKAHFTHWEEATCQS